MQLIQKDLKHGKVKLKVTVLDDLWYISHFIDSGDDVTGKTERKIKLGTGEERQAKVIKRWVTLKIKVEKVEFHPSASILRISGKILEGPEDIPRGSYHTINVEEQSIIAIEKEKWLKYQIERLHEATETKHPKILILVLDREEALFALMKPSGYQVLSSIKGDVQQKRISEQKKGSFYADLLKLLVEYDTRYKLGKIIIGSPAFWKEDLLKELKDPELRKKIILATCSDAGEHGIQEVLKRPETRNALHEDRVSKEMELVEKLLQEIAKDKLAVYGIAETKAAVQAGAVQTLLITDSFIQHARQKGTYEDIDQLLKMTDAAKGEIMMVSSGHEGGKKLDGLGGIAALVRWKVGESFKYN